jgi:hypothetical protein
MLRQPVCFNGERFDSREIGTKTGATHGREVGRPPPVWSRFDIRGAPDMGVADGEERPERVVVDELDDASRRDLNAEQCHGWCARPRSIRA